MRVMGRPVVAVLLLVILLVVRSSGQLLKPVSHDGMTESLKDNKFAQREATDDLLPFPQLDEEELGASQCPQHLELRWQTEVGSSIYATPLISDINGDGKLEIVVPTFVHYLEVLEGADGEKLTGWPMQHQETVHASALLYDIDKDHNKEIVLPTFNGEIRFYKSGGWMIPEKMIVPRLKVRKDWHVGLASDPVDRTNPDVKDKSLIEEHMKVLEAKKAEIAKDTQSNLENKEADAGGDAVSNSGAEETDDTDSQGNEADVANDPLSNSDTVGQETILPQRRLFQAEDSTRENADGKSGEAAKTNGADATPTVSDPDPMEEDAAASFDVFEDKGLPEEYAYDYDDYVNEDMWGDEEWDTLHHLTFEDMVEVDAHILATPVIADIDKDGINEMVVAVSYFYDHEYYSTPEHAKELGENIDPSKYVAGAIVVFNLDTKQVKWEFQMDLSTDYSKYRAYIYSAPTVVDLDGDGYLEILVGNSVGFIYAITHDGQNRKGFPKQMGEVQSQVVAADINDDGKIEIVTTDSVGNVAVWTGEGKELWEVHLKSLISQGPSVGDVDGDGHTDLVVPTTSGNIYVLRGSDGSSVGPYPFRTHGRVMAPALLVDLSKRGDERKGLTIAIGSFDGYFYLIDGPTGCADAIDIGETSYSMALADNVDGGDDLDIIVTTMNGNVYCFQTPAPYHPLKAWPMQTQGRNVFASRYQREGIFVLPFSRRYRDEAGDSFHVQFEIVDKHTIPSGSMAPYKVKVSLVSPGNYRGDKNVAYEKEYEQPGVYSMTLKCVSSRLAGTVLVEMTDKNSLYFYDEFALTFHMRYYQILKWLLALPLLLMAGMFLLFPPQEERISLLPRDRHQL